ncbi:hypothetical protein K466DRAFT_407357 [Polyporus arcularius HHB13444]|uniref:Uncharacterized protein n=1 Tax=Polyporus arcularius HHB13444 TaxID=1314778 RepID=A0A5C3PV71_9APHY|nr:hypothetical protein K466DRAFT_407357 [Polyporus arcularius HHB13444]
MGSSRNPPNMSSSPSSSRRRPQPPSARPTLLSSASSVPAPPAPTAGICASNNRVPLQRNGYPTTTIAVHRDPHNIAQTQQDDLITATDMQAHTSVLLRTMSISVPRSPRVAQLLSWCLLCTAGPANVWNFELHAFVWVSLEHPQSRHLDCSPTPRTRRLSTRPAAAGNAAYELLHPASTNRNTRQEPQPHEPQPCLE